MANFEVGNIRNIALIAHSGAGKTSLAEAMLFSSGMTDRLGNVQDGTTVTDFEPEEIDRKITITSSLAFCNWNKYRINLIDTPGFINFIDYATGTIHVGGPLGAASGSSAMAGNGLNIDVRSSRRSVPILVEMATVVSTAAQRMPTA